VSSAHGVESVPSRPRVARTDKSWLARQLAAGHFVTVVELVPPRGHDTSPIVQRARLLKERGVDLVNVPDAPRAGARLSALALAVLIEQQGGIETLLHYSSRDRTIVSIQSDLLGAHAMGLRNVLLLTGDPSRVGEYQDATAVFEVDSIGLTNVVVRLNQGQDVGGQTIGSPTGFHIGVSFNPGASNLDEELRRFEYKVEAGAEFVMTRPVYDVAHFERVLKRIEFARLPVVAGVYPFESVRNAEFMANEVPGSRVPETLLARMRRADMQGSAGDEGVAIAREVARALRGQVQGIQVSTLSGSVEAVLAVLDGLR
jgi:homocysteine S-methyltransferase